MKISYWRLYLSAPVTPGHTFIVISNAEAKRVRKHFETDKRGLIEISVGTEAGETPRALYINIDHITALEPIES